MDEAEKELLPEHRSPPLGYDPPELPSRSALQRVIIAVAASVALMLGVTIFSGASLSDCLMDHSTDQPAPDTYDRIHASKVFFNIPSPEHLQKHLKYYTSGTHFGGRDTKAAEYTRAFFENCGIKTQVVQYYPWLGFPGHHHVTVFNATTEHVLFKAKMTEDEITSDPATQYRSNLPAFHAYSGSGNVSGALVYANYGEVGDYRALDAAGISVEGKVVLVRYGEIARGIKVQLAEQHGARGVLIYSDPSDDGYGKGKVYPDGPWRPATSIERGSVALTQIYPGDPLTPGYAATKNAPRINPKDAQNLNHIPSLPLSYQDAEPLLRTLAGHGKRANQLGDSWTGGLVSRGVEYWTGPSTLHVNMLNTVQHKQVAIQNVIGTITGTDEEDRAVIIGSHHDAWSAGATDPGSGAAALLEVARGLGELMKLGWKPRRTIILASWDATEHGLVGATEWVEANVDWMRHEVLAYLNVNSAVAGDRFTAAASPLLHDLLYQLARQIPMPHTNTSLYDAWNRQSTDSSTPFIDTIGSGGSSDTAAFQLHAGVASLDMGFRGLAGTHNSNYDSAQWMQR
ncbi:Vacuolar protein sorting-associated protein 70, partial [Linderina macrospora]